MTDESLDAAERAFIDHADFESVGNGAFLAERTPFVGEVHLAEDDGDVSYRVVARVPILDEVVVGETVADVIQDGWHETLERRLADAHKVTNASASPPDVAQEEGTVLVEVTFRDADSQRAPTEAQAILDFILGTWMQGIIPGYEYTENVQALRDRAAQNNDERNQGSNLTI